MANPKFTDENGANSYTWEHWSNLPGDRPDLAVRMRERNYTLTHQRNKVIFARAILTQLGEWTLVWKNIPLAMITSLNYFYGLNKFRFYPDSLSGFYWLVFIDGNWNPKNQRGGTFDLQIVVKEI